MSILRTLNILSEQRVDVSHVRAIESAVRNDFDTLVTSVLTGTGQGYIIRGFDLITAGAIGSAANGLQMRVDNSAVLHIAASVSGTVFQTPLGTANQVLSAATNTNVSGSFTASSTNYIGLDYNRFADPSTNETKYIWNSSASDEITTIAPAAQTLTFKIVISTSVWASNVLPIAIVKTDSNGNVLSITDSRWNLFSLETGGINPDPNHVYPWTAGRTQPPVTTTSNSVNPFIGGDKQLDSFKAWANSIMSLFKEVRGTPSWFSGATGGGSLPSLQSLSQDLGNTVITGKGSIAHGVNPVDKKTLTAPGQINWDQEVDIKVIGSSTTYVLAANPTSSNISLADDQVAYITFTRDAPIVPNLIFIAGSPVLASVGAVSWTTGILPGDFIKVASNTVSGYYQVLSNDTASQVTLTTSVSLADGTGAAGTQAQYSFGSYQASPSPSTPRDIFITSRALVPQGADVFWLFLREDNGGSPRVYVRFLGAELDNGEDRKVDGTTSEEILIYTGATSAADFLPEYVAQVSPGSVPRITNITVGAASTITGGQYFLINSPGDFRKYYVWFKKSGVGTDPVPPATNGSIEVDILSGDSATQVASKLAAALAGTVFGDFTAVSGVGTVVVTNNSAGVTNPAVNFDVGFPFAVTSAQAGTGVANFIIHDGDNLTLGIKELDEELGKITRLLDEPSYDESVEIVASGATPPTSLNGPISSGTNISLPNNSRMGNNPQDYTVGKGVLEVCLNGIVLDLGGADPAWAEVGALDSQSNEIQILTDLVVGDELHFRIDVNGGGGGLQGPQGAPGVAGIAGPPGMNSAGGPVAISVKFSDYTILTSDCFLAADCSSNNITFTLPPAAGNTGRIFYCKKVDADPSPYTLTIVGSGSDIVEFGLLPPLTGQGQSVSLISNGVGYWAF